MTDIGPETAILLKESWITANGWRLSVTASPSTRNRRRLASLLESVYGPACALPAGPFILASILRCPVNLIFALPSTASCIFTAKPLPTRCCCRWRTPAGAAKRYRSLRRASGIYALQSPLDWFNFFDFWQLPESRTRSKGCLTIPDLPLKSSDHSLSRRRYDGRGLAR